MKLGLFNRLVIFISIAGSFLKDEPLIHDHQKINVSVVASNITKTVVPAPLQAEKKIKDSEFLGPNPKVRIEKMMAEYRQLPHDNFPPMSHQILEDLFIEANMARKEWPEAETVVKDFVFSEIETTARETEGDIDDNSMHYVALRVYGRLESDPAEVKKAANIVLSKYRSPASKKKIEQCMVNSSYQDFHKD